MHRIFAGTAVWTILLFVLQFAVGFFVTTDNLQMFRVHMLGGLFLGTFVCVLHVMVMFHFVGSGKELKEAAEILGENADIYQKVRRFKAQTFPYATFAPLLTGAAVILGGGADTGVIPSWVHWSVGLGALLLNLKAFPVEYRALQSNLDLIREVDRRIREEISPAVLREEIGSPNPEERNK